MTRQRYLLCICLFCLCFPRLTLAFWQVINVNNADSGLTLQVARQMNDDGYRVEIYRDAINAVRLRFTSTQKHARLSENFCPSFQVDDFKIFNRSINDAKCIRHSEWVEFVLGYVNEGHIDSTALYRIQNGNQLAFRFLLENDSYEETFFSLAGSSRVILKVIGEDVMIRKTRR